MSVLAIFQTRLGSTRFPRKAVAELDGKPLIRHVVDRVQAIPSVSDVVVATPYPEGGLIAFHGRLNECRPPLTVMHPDVPESDVLGRFVKVVENYPTDLVVMRVTGDCPVLDPEIAEHVVNLYFSAQCEYASNITPGYVDGEDVEVFSQEALLRAHCEATDADDREHVTPWLRRHVQTATLAPATPRSALKLSVDTPADLARIRQWLARRGSSCLTHH